MLTPRMLLLCSSPPSAAAVMGAITDKTTKQQNIPTHRMHPTRKYLFHPYVQNSWASRHYNCHHRVVRVPASIVSLSVDLLTEDLRYCRREQMEIKHKVRMARDAKGKNNEQTYLYEIWTHRCNQDCDFCACGLFFVLSVLQSFLEVRVPSAASTESLAQCPEWLRVWCPGKCPADTD